MPENYDFSGYATRANVRCADGRTILKDAFKGQDGAKVPIVWMHRRDDPENVLGHGILENREDGVFVYGYLNDSAKANRVKALLEHGDITALSIYAIDLNETRKQVSHGLIKEVSIVIAGANPEASIQNVCIQHGDGDIDILADQAIIVSGEDWEDLDDISHSVEESNKKSSSDKDPTAAEVFDSLNPDQKNLFYAVLNHIADSLEDDSDSDDANDEEKTSENVQHSADEFEKGGNSTVSTKYNAFEGTADGNESNKKTLTHSDEVEIFKRAQQVGSLRAAVESYTEENNIEHGITQIEELFPEAKAVSNTPDLISRPQEWVAKVWNATSKSPFSRVKTIHADVTADEARAKGYTKGKKKIEEVFGLMKRVTTPQTVYKLQKIDRDDILDITSFDVVAWMRGEMRIMLNEELSRAILVSDGRSKGEEDKISEDHIRPIYSDDELYAIHKLVNIKADDDTREDKADAYIDAVYEARNDYRGSGNPTLYCPSAMVTDMLLARDNIGRRLYNTVTELASALRVKEIVEIPVMEGTVRETGADQEALPAGYTKQTKYDLLGIIVNLVDYRIGADRGGAVTMFDDFDLNYNKYEYLIETRCSGALTRPKSAIVLEKKHTGE